MATLECIFSTESVFIDSAMVHLKEISYSYFIANFDASYFIFDQFIFLYIFVQKLCSLHFATLCFMVKFNTNHQAARSDSDNIW